MINGFNAHRIKHHRNGISGVSFWAVHFSCNLTDYTPAKYQANMLAIVPYGKVSPDPVPDECFVMDLNDGDECWRGENFFELMIGAINKHKDG